MGVKGIGGGFRGLRGDSLGGDKRGVKKIGGVKGN